MQLGVLAYSPVAGCYLSRLLSERAANILDDRGWQINIKPAPGFSVFSAAGLRKCNDWS